MFGGARTVRALKGIDLKVERGRTLAVVGESGCGKSTLARIITMIDAPTGGELLIEGEKVDIARDGVSRELRRKVQIVFQNPYGSLNPRQKIGDVLAEPLKLNTVAAGARAARPGDGDAAEGRAEARALQPLPAHVLRRPAPAHRHRPRHHGAPGAAGARRAGLGARPLGAGADPQPAAGPAGRVSPHLRLHLATTSRWSATSPTT